MTVRGGDKIKAALNKAENARGVGLIRVGFFKHSKYPGGQFVAMIALINEYGTDDGRIPERPFFRQALLRIRDGVSDLIKESIDTQAGVVDEQLADKIGSMVAGAIQKRISDLRTPPNAPSTLAKKAPKTNPLINTGTMRTAVTWSIG